MRSLLRCDDCKYLNDLEWCEKRRLFLRRHDKKWRASRTCKAFEGKE